MNGISKRLLVGLGVTALVLLTLPVSAGQPGNVPPPPPPPPGTGDIAPGLEEIPPDAPEAVPGKPGKLDWLAKELGLKPEQQEQMKQFRAAQEAKNKPLLEQLRAVRKELKLELEKPGVDRDKAYAIAGTINGLQGELLKNRINGILKMKEILTPEQYQKLQEIRERKKPRGLHERGEKQEGGRARHRARFMNPHDSNAEVKNEKCPGKN